LQQIEIEVAMQGKRTPTSGTSSQYLAKATASESQPAYAENKRKGEKNSWLGLDPRLTFIKKTGF
jgi:hypothetical protein